MDMFSKVFDLVPVLSNNFWLRTLVLRYELWNIEDFGVVKDAWLYLADAQRLITIVAAVLEVRAVSQQFLRWESVEFLSDGELTIYLLLAEAEVDDVEEA